MTSKADLLEQCKKNMADGRTTYKWTGTKNIGGAGNTGGKNVICGYIPEKGSPVTSSYPCHAPIRDYKNALALWSAFGYRTKDDTAKKYFDWLLFKSPWSETGIVPRELDDEFMFNQGFIWTGLDKIPGNLIHNFLVASRMAAEWPHFIEAWMRLVSEGVGPTYAFYSLTLWTRSGGANWNGDGCWVGHNVSTWSGVDKYDWPLDTFRASEDYITNFLSGKTEGLSEKMFYPNCATVPVNTLWGKLHIGKGSYVKFLEKEYKELFDKQTVASAFVETHTAFVISQANIMKIIRSEEVRLGLKKGMRAAA